MMCAPGLLVVDKIRFKTRLLEVASVGGFALGENGHNFAVARPRLKRKQPGP